MARHKKTEPLAPDIGPPELSAKEMALIEALAEGLSYCDAYKAAYGADGYSKNALYVAASRKVSEPKIQAALAQMQAIGLAKIGLRHGDVREKRIAEEYEFHWHTRATGNDGAAGGAYDRINKLYGLYVDKHENVTDYDPIKILDGIAKHSPELAQAMAKEKGINWQPKETVH